MIPASIDLTKTTQIGFLTHNIVETTKKWAEYLHTEVPEIITSAEYELTKAVYRGRPCYARIYQSFFQLDNIQIELIQPVDDQPSIWRECLDQNGEGLHHIAFLCINMAEMIKAYEDEGMILLQKGEYKGGRYAYLDNRRNTKLIIELLENDERP